MIDQKMKTELINVEVTDCILIERKT